MNIDVIIPTYNNGRFLEEAVSSVQKQTYLPKQIIIVDDGSTDNTGEILAVLKKTSTIPIISIQKKNGGPNSARNAGLHHSTSELVAFLDADDRWEPEKLQEQLQCFKADTENTLGLVYGNYKHIDTDGNDRFDIPTVPLNRKIKGYVFEYLLPGNLILGSASNVLIRRSVFDTVGIFDEELRIGEDWDMWLRIAKKFRIEYVDKVIVSIRRHGGNTTKDVTRLIEGDISFIETWIPRIENQYRIPTVWRDRIIFNILRGFPSLTNFHLAKHLLTEKTRKKLFIQTYGSISLACFVFIIRAIFNKEMRKRILASLKRYGAK